jgi:hypothetical protein
MNKILSLQEFRNRMNDIVTMTVTCKYANAIFEDACHNQMHKEVDSTTPKGKARYNKWVKGYVAALCDAAYSNITQNQVEYCYLLDRELYTTSKKDTGKKKLRYYTGNIPISMYTNYPHGLYWIGTDKLWY